MADIVLYVFIYPLGLQKYTTLPIILENWWKQWENEWFFLSSLEIKLNGHTLPLLLQHYILVMCTWNIIQFIDRRKSHYSLQYIFLSRKQWKSVWWFQAMNQKIALVLQASNQTRRILTRHITKFLKISFFFAFSGFSVVFFSQYFFRAKVQCCIQFSWHIVSSKQ